jgi:membrane protein YdbS with pleckstrin-like domain
MAAETVTESPEGPELSGPFRRLDPRIRVIWTVRGGMVAVVIGLVLGVAAVAPGPDSPVPLWVPLVVFTALLALAVLSAVLRYRRWRFRVREDSLYLERGVLTHVRTVVPYVRIQHVDASRGPFERALGLSSVVVYTAGSRGADVSIPGLVPGDADDLQERLKRLAIAAEGEDAV